MTQFGLGGRKALVTGQYRHRPGHRHRACRGGGVCARGPRQDTSARMGADTAKDIYRERAATAECVNAQARNRGLTCFLVRGLEKVKAVALWYALAHNMACSWRLAPT